MAEQPEVLLRITLSHPHPSHPINEVEHTDVVNLSLTPGQTDFLREWVRAHTTETNPDRVGLFVDLVVKDKEGEEARHFGGLYRPGVNDRNGEDPFWPTLLALLEGRKPKTDWGWNGLL